MKIELKSEVYKVSKIAKATKAIFFRDIEVGDLLTITTVLKDTYGYAPEYKCHNLTKKKAVKLTLNHLSGRLKSFELKEF